MARHRQVDLRRGQYDEAAVDLVGVEIERVAEFVGHLRREAGAVDLEGGAFGRRQAEAFSALL